MIFFLFGALEALQVILVGHQGVSFVFFISCFIFFNLYSSIAYFVCASLLQSISLPWKDHLVARFTVESIHAHTFNSHNK